MKEILEQLEAKRQTARAGGGQKRIDAQAQMLERWFKALDRR